MEMAVADHMTHIGILIQPRQSMQIGQGSDFKPHDHRILFHSVHPTRQFKRYDGRRCIPIVSAECLHHIYLTSKKVRLEYHCPSREPKLLPSTLPASIPACNDLQHSIRNRMNGQYNTFGVEAMIHVVNPEVIFFSGSQTSIRSSRPPILRDAAS